MSLKAGDRVRLTAGEYVSPDVLVVVELLDDDQVLVEDAEDETLGRTTVPADQLVSE